MSYGIFDRRAVKGYKQLPKSPSPRAASCVLPLNQLFLTGCLYTSRAPAALLARPLSPPDAEAGASPHATSLSSTHIHIHAAHTLNKHTHTHTHDMTHTARMNQMVQRAHAAPSLAPCVHKQPSTSDHSLAQPLAHPLSQHVQLPLPINTRTPWLHQSPHREVRLLRPWPRHAAPRDCASPRRPRPPFAPLVSHRLRESGLLRA